MAFGIHCRRFPAMSIVCLLIVVVIILYHAEGIEARPSWTLPAITFVHKFQQVTLCAKDSEILELCQRCAKATKSNFAYPMCCANEEGATHWCRDYLYFGIQ